ncbi:MAG TPA: 2-dehydropantoate 2-reductase [Pseudomonadota bacterium]|nr:2-dehydropantoate 2-reductase [Pseudomonadota bacterium]
MSQTPRFLLLGCGGIGGIVAALLGRAGGDVTVITGNQAITSAVLRQGIRIRDLDGKEWTNQPASVVTKVAELPSGGHFDVCLAATKLTTLTEALGDALPVLSDTTNVLCLQNGLPEAHAAKVVGDERVVGCVVGFGATLVEPGFSARTSTGGFQIGRYKPRETDTDLARVAALLDPAIPTRFVKDLSGVRWSKLAINCATSTLGAIGGDTLGRLLAQRFVRRLVLEVWRELCAVANCEGIRLAKVAGTIDIAKLALSDEDKRHKVGSLGLFFKHSLLWGLGLKFRKMRSSMAIAIERGRKPEIDWLNGEIVRRGELHGVHTPLNRELLRVVHDLVAKRKKPGLDTLYSTYLRLESGQIDAGEPRTTLEHRAPPRHTPGLELK